MAEVNHLKRAIVRQYHDAGVIEVEAPEWPGEDGKPSVVRFKTRMSVDDFNVFVSLGQSGSKQEMKPDGTMTIFAAQRDEHPNVTLFRLLAVQEDGVTPLVDPNDDKWFREQADGPTVAAIVDRAHLESAVIETNQSVRSEESEDSVPAEKPKLESA